MGVAEETYVLCEYCDGCEVPEEAECAEMDLRRLGVAGCVGVILESEDLDLFICGDTLSWQTIASFTSRLPVLGDLPEPMDSELRDLLLSIPLELAGMGILK